MKKYNYSNEIANVVKQFLTDDDWHYSFDEERGIFDFGLRVRSKIQNSNADPYWDEAATSLLSAEIAYTLMTKDNATFADVLELHDSLVLDEGSGTIRTSLDGKFEYIASKEPTCFAVSCWKSFKNLPIKTAGCVFGTLNTTIDTIFSPELSVDDICVFCRCVATIPL